MLRFLTIFSCINCFFIALLHVTPVSHASQINTADRQEAVHNKFCPRLKKALKKQQFKYECVPSKGIRESSQRVEKDPSQLSYAQFDIYALENSHRTDKDGFQTIRNDIGKACLFLVTKNKDITNFGHVAAKAKDLHFVLPPENSSHVGTFEYLQQIDSPGLGQAKKVIYADSIDAAVEEVLQSDDTKQITMFVQFPDADHKRFKEIAKKGGRFIPVIDRNILRQDIAGEKIYFAEETEIVNPNWTQKGLKLVTSCTPIILFTGRTKNIVEADEQKDHKDLIRTLSKIEVTDLQPEQNFLTKLWKQTKALSAQSVEQFIQASEKAREAVGPTLDKAKEIGEKAIEASKPGLEKAKELGQKALDKAKDITGQVIEDVTKSTEGESDSQNAPSDQKPEGQENSQDSDRKEI